MTVSSKVPVWARRVRAVRGKESQQSFAHRAGISMATLSRIERGIQTPRWGTALSLSEATGKPASFFYGEDDDEERSLVAALRAFRDNYMERGPEVVDSRNYGRRSTDRQGVAA